VTTLQGARETDWVCIPGRGNRFFVLQKYPDRPRSTPNLHFSGYRGLFSREQSSRSLTLTPHLIWFRG